MGDDVPIPDFSKKLAVILITALNGRGRVIEAFVGV